MRKRNIERLALFGILGFAALFLGACDAVLYSYYGLGEEGRVENAPFGERTWYSNRGEVWKIGRLEDGRWEFTPEESENEVQSFVVNFVEHEEQRIFDAQLVTSGDYEGAAVSVYAIGRFERYGECVAFEVLVESAVDVFRESGLPVYRRLGGKPAEPTPFVPDPKDNPISQLFAVMDAERPTELTTAEPAQLRQFLVSNQVDSMYYVPLILSPGEPPLTPRGRFDNAAWEERHPEAAARWAELMQE